ncbi:protein translocase subunit SecD [Candidatus Falkowbacteria bacterium CG10_big_fil_rev_8_21_14_0_10_43_10]|uniref:Protein translocase subunit SecD n=1 Tax=Candidatus Falkowbacteria bacterium CG10_big_fil_rev_8_21_14_0_10_43_10 TaxID=1974567 RepID=A0A2H0V2U0_9BACT|nr:MAG: protein translocase subunit SecD [Candidatus Falkowbacteria bacterium CG10_big_fil_rev_8_21_14_0_10_43_10]
MFKSEIQKIRAIFAGVIIITIIAALVDFGQIYNKYAGSALPNVKELPFRLGLDLLGGTHLLYQADVSAIPTKDRSVAVEGVRDVIERRVNVFGVSEPVVQTANSGGDYRIIVELAGIKDVNVAIKMIGETPLLEFKEENTGVKELTPEQKKEMDEYNKNAKLEADEILRKLRAGGDFDSLKKEFDESGINDSYFVRNTSDPEIFSGAEISGAGNTSTSLLESAAGWNIIKVEEKRAVKEAGDLGLDQREVRASHILVCYEGSERCTSGYTKEDARNRIDDIKNQATPDNFAELAKQNSIDASSSDGGDLGWFTREMMVKPFADAVFNLEKGKISDVVETQFGFHLIYKTDERTLYEYKIKRILINNKTKEDILGPQDPWKNTELTGKYLKRATVQFNPNDNSPEVQLEFDSEGKDLFADITKRNVKKSVAIFLDGEPISIPTVNEAITSGDAVITGRFTIKEAKLLAQRLNAGALPVPIKLINQNTVGATLGKASVDASLRAGLWGILLVALFMIVIYRLPGLLSVFALAVYGLLILAIFKLWPVTLTLAGIAGFILSIGMAVDANVLIFSRLAEELRAGKPWHIALNESFRRAWPSIRDGNATTLLTCLILIQFGTSIIKGFAVTLTIGVLINMFSALVVTKYIMKFVISEKIAERSWLFGVKSKLL